MFSLVRVAFAVLTVLCLCYVGGYLVGPWLGDGVVRASVPAVAEPESGSCCLIPANKGLHKGRPW